MTTPTQSLSVAEARSRLATKRGEESEVRKLRHQLAGRLLQDPYSPDTLALAWELVDKNPRNKPFWGAVNVAREMMRDCTEESAYHFMKVTLTSVFGEDIVRVACRCRSLYFRWESPWRQFGSTNAHAVNA